MRGTGCTWSSVVSSPGQSKYLNDILSLKPGHSPSAQNGTQGCIEMKDQRGMEPFLDRVQIYLL